AQHHHPEAYRSSDVQPLLRRLLGFNNDGQVDSGEHGIPGVPITLMGTDDRGHTLNLSQNTNTAGSYVFLNLRPDMTGSARPSGQAPMIQGSTPSAPAAGAFP